MDYPILNAKVRLKAFLLNKLHAREEIVSRIATRVVRDGVPRAFEWSFEQERKSILNYVADRRVDRFDYHYAVSSRKPTLYASAFAFMLHSLFDAFDDQDMIDGWIEHFDRHQCEDGLFRDPVLAGNAFEHIGDWGEGWGARHLASLLTIPYARANRRPPRQFAFLEPYYNLNYLENWFTKFSFDDCLWSQSNYVMNLYTLLQFARDYMDEVRAGAAVQVISSWLLKHQNSKTGLWHTHLIPNRAALNDAIRGAYHFYPLFEYEGITVPYQEAAIDRILTTQNAWGAFEQENMPAGACEDIDALDPLLRFCRRTGYKRDEVRRAARRSLVWLCACKNVDGGMASMPEHGFAYGGHPETTSEPGESNLFATWFRTLTTAYVTRFLGLPEAYVIGRYPGYEIDLPKEFIHKPHVVT